jgi:hypothetical protein
MSTTPPNGAKDSKKELNNALVWAFLAAAFAVGMFLYSGKVDPEKKTFYLIGGAIGAIVAVFNGYTAWTLSKNK